MLKMKAFITVRKNLLCTPSHLKGGRWLEIGLQLIIMSNRRNFLKSVIAGGAVVSSGSIASAKDSPRIMPLDR